ncbi:hypothetical protein [Enterovirga sp.]|jgi:hypothetical protein|uniref:hypothetical protein n=1 Tax=Enterovirga sp. TaxID=2026350 RepID=UPI00263816A5|nr:hypothetical protein [Enterovirga sp.]MDB5590692.1 hypothetical protein [Enterovirga sp.]
MSEDGRRGEVVSFPVSRGLSRPTRAADRGGVVVLFTGVRYDRAVTELPPPPPVGGCARPPGESRAGG